MPTSAQAILDRLAERRGWSERDRLGFLAQFVDSLGPEAIARLDEFVEDALRQYDEFAVGEAITDGRTPLWPYTPGAFLTTFESPFEEQRGRNGQPFAVLESFEPGHPDGDAFRHIYRIRFDDGAELMAWAEEVCVPAGRQSEPPSWSERMGQRPGRGAARPGRSADHGGEREESR
jgi:hypothetical protein